MMLWTAFIVAACATGLGASNTTDAWAFWAIASGSTTGVVISNLLGRRDYRKNQEINRVTPGKDGW